MKKRFKIFKFLVPFLVLTLLSAMIFHWIQFQRVGIKQNIQMLLLSLEETSKDVPMVGFHQSDDNSTFTIQKIEGAGANGVRVWSPVLQVYHYDSAKGEVQLGTSDLSILNLPRDLSSPTALTSKQIQQVQQDVFSGDDFEAILKNVTFFSVERTGSNTIEVKVQSSVPFSEDEVVESKRKFFLRSL